MTDITLSFQQNNRTVQSKTEQTVKSLLKDTSELRTHLSNEKKQANENLKGLKDKICEETEKIEDCIGEIQREKLENERKVDSMLQDLDILLNATVDE